MALAAGGTWLRFWLEGTLLLDTHSRPFVASSAIAGAGLILAGVGSLRLAPLAGRLSWRALWCWTLAVHGVALASLALTSKDVFMNLAFGALKRAGLSPYAHAPVALGDAPLVQLVASEWAKDRTPYGPLFHPFAALTDGLGAALGPPIWGPFFSFKAVLLAALLAALALAARHLRRTRPAEAAETFAVLALGPVLAWEVTAQGHNDGLLFLALTAFLVAASAEREVLAVLALAVGVGIKYSIAPLLGLYLILVARRSLARAVTLALLAAIVMAAAIAPEWGSITMRSVPLVGGDVGGGVMLHAHSLADLVCMVLEALAGPTASVIAYRILSATSAVLCAAVLLVTAWRARTFEQMARGYLVFLFTLYLTVPWFQPWYLAWALPFLVVEPDPRWRRFVAVFAVVTVAQWALPLDPVTTVIGDAWAAWRILRLLRGADDRAGATDAPAAGARQAACYPAFPATGSEP